MVALFRRGIHPLYSVRCETQRTEETEAQVVQKFLRVREVVDKTGLPQSTIYELMKRNEFPQNFHISPRLVAWSEKDIAAWQARRLGTEAEA